MLAEATRKILAYLQRTPLIARTEAALEDKTQSALEKAIILLRSHLKIRPMWLLRHRISKADRLTTMEG
jgi:hypothetical protein